MHLLAYVYILIAFICGWMFFFRGRVIGKTNIKKPRLKVSLIIPARNEADNLRKLLASIAESSYLPDEIIVVNDSSTDDTVKVAHQYGAKVVDVVNKPAGWVGKTYPCYTGALSAEHQCLFFLDADCFFEKNGLEAIIAEYQEKQEVISIEPYHKLNRAYENLSAFSNLMVISGVPDFSVLKNNSKLKRLFGPALIIDKNIYFKMGGHEAVKDQILENFYFSKILLENKIPFRSYLGKGVLSFRMYGDGFANMIEGWTKSQSLGAYGVSAALLVLAVLWIAGCVSVSKNLIKSIAAEPALIWFFSVLYALFSLQIKIFLTRIGNFHWLTALLFPIPLLFFQIIFFKSLFQTFVLKKVVWKNRTIKFD